jgi:hypothetical protein
VLTQGKRLYPYLPQLDWDGDGGVDASGDPKNGEEKEGVTVSGWVEVVEECKLR